MRGICGGRGWVCLSLVNVIAWMQPPAEESRDWLLKPGGDPKEGQLDKKQPCSLYLFPKFYWFLWFGRVWLFIPWGIPGSGMGSVVGVQIWSWWRRASHHRVPSVSYLAQCLQTLFRRWQSPWGGVDGEAMSPDCQLMALKSYSRITANVVAMSEATFRCFDSEDLCVFKICSRRKTFW